MALLRLAKSHNFSISLLGFNIYIPTYINYLARIRPNFPDSFAPNLINKLPAELLLIIPNVSKLFAKISANTPPRHIQRRTCQIFPVRTYELTPTTLAGTGGISFLSNVAAGAASID